MTAKLMDLLHLVGFRAYTNCNKESLATPHRKGIQMQSRYR